jgi:LacI family transcriptional regulator
MLVDGVAWSVAVFSHCSSKSSFIRKSKRSLTVKNNDRFTVGVSLDLTWNLKRHTDIFAGVARYAHEHNDFHCIIDDFADDTLKRSRGTAVPFDGVIGRVTPGLAAISKQRNVPLVNVWYSSPVKSVPAVFSDNAGAGTLLAEHLLTRGIRRFLCIIRRDDVGEREQNENFRQLVLESGGSCKTLLLPLRFANSPSRWRPTKAAIERWLDSVPSPAGVMAGVDIIARHVAQICTERGLRVPEDIAIAGGYNEPSICLYPEPSLTSVEFGLDRVGYEAARTMHKLLLGKNRQEQPVVLPPQELIVRQSSDFVYVDEEIVSSAIQFISKHNDRAISVDEVAVAVGVSRRTLEMRFEKHVGRSVAAEIRRMRIDQAKRLLASSEVSIFTVASLTGIGTPQQFARLFRREVGVSPREYRKQFQTKE